MAVPNVGQELLNVPFPEMVKNLALAIAEGQSAMDQNSINDALELAKDTINLPTIPADGSAPDPNVITAFPLIAFITPTFYQFTSAIIEVKMAITMTISTDASVSATGKANFKVFSASVNASYSYWKFNYSVEGSSLLHIELGPVTPPKALTDYLDAYIQASTAKTAAPTPVTE